MKMTTLAWLKNIALIGVLSFLASCNSGTTEVTDLSTRSHDNIYADNEITTPCPPAASLLWEAPTIYPDLATPLPSADIIGYHILYSTVLGSYSSEDSISVGNVTSYAISDMPLTAGTNTIYYFVVTAYTSSSESSPSNEICITVP